MATNDKAWDIGFHREIGDESNPTWSIVVGGTSKALHIVDALIAGTDFNVGAGTNTALFVHGDTTPVTKYGKFFTDETDFFFQPVGVNAVISVPSAKDVTFQVNNTNEYIFDSATADFQGNNLGSLGNAVFVTGKSLIGTGLKLDGGGTAISFGAASYVASGTGTVAAAGVLGPAEVGSVSVKGWLKLKDAAGTAICYVPYYNA
uniref:Uncharacterized protein n=1 Tax=viral metagenome TaxID=1070528 RepID=A0A6M3J8P3_9ZZZZ